VTEEKAGIEEEPIVSFIREEQDDGDTNVEPAMEISTTEVLEGEIVEIEEGVAEEPDEVTTLRQQLEEAQAQADEYLDDLRRERAAFQNYKRRQENERAELRQMATAGLLMQILPILDDLERALAAFPEDQADQPWAQGVDLIQRKLQTTLEGIGVVPVEAEPGQSFDPFVHEAVSYEENDDHQEGEIIDVVQNGYKLGERTLRPAMVRVAK
jgi:molecular chaperone GrpE